MILYRPVGLQEIELIYDNGMKAFPASLPQQPIFYPVLQLEYARQIASDWNAKNEPYAGYVTQFKVEDQYLDQFEKHTIGESQHEEFWIPAEELETFNQHISGHIKVVEAYFGEPFQGFVPDKFGLQGKDAIAQFTLLTNSYLYKRMDFYLEIRRNHKAIFLNYPFWQKYEFKNQGLKEKILQVIKEAWFASFPQTPLVSLVHVDDIPGKQTYAQPLENPVPEEDAAVNQANPDSLVKPVHEDVSPLDRTTASALMNPADEESMPMEQIDTHAQSMVNSLHEDDTPTKQIHARAHFLQGLEWGQSGKYQEAVGELSRAVEEDPAHVVAYTSLGVAFRRLGEDDRALSCYEAALRMDPIHAEAHYFRANILYSQGHFQEAIAGYRIAIGLKPELIEAHQNPVPEDRLTDYSRSPAEMYWIARPAYRILDLNKALESNPRQADLFKERAVEYYRLRNYVLAIADYSLALEKDPFDASVLHSRGVAYERIGQLDRALEDYQRATAIDPQLSDVYINRGITFGKMGSFRQSIASFTESIRLAPRNPNGYFNRGMSYFQQGDVRSAIDDFSNAIRLAPGDEAAYYWRGLCNEEAGHQREAIADYRQFLVLSEDVNAREQIERKLSAWDAGKPGSANSSSAVLNNRQKADQAQSEEPGQYSDLYSLMAALGERALKSTWFGSGIDCHGEKAEELYALTDQNKPIEGRYLLYITSGISQMNKGDFQAFDPDTTSHWIFIRALGGGAFYIETDDPKIKDHLKTSFQVVEEVEGESSPYEGFVITTDQTSI